MKNHEIIFETYKLERSRENGRIKTGFEIVNLFILCYINIS
jgi:hypothetical protein